MDTIVLRILADTREPGDEVKHASLQNKLYVICSVIYHIEGNFHMVQNFTVFTDRSAAAKIRTMKISM